MLMAPCRVRRIALLSSLFLCQKQMVQREKVEELESSLLQDSAEDQNLELGAWQQGKGEGGLVLTPLEEAAWAQRQAALRHSILDKEAALARQVVQEVDTDTMLHKYDKVGILHILHAAYNTLQEVSSEKRRRAAVFYVDRGESVLACVRWWLYTWTFIGLNSADQAEAIFITRFFATK